MTRGICKRLALGACALVAALSPGPAAATATYGWEFHNTSWYDFDVGGHVMCGIVYDYTAPIQLPMTRVICEPSGATQAQWPNSPRAAGLAAIAVDDDGRAWVLTKDSYIYYADQVATAAAISGNTWHYWHGPYGVVSGGCSDQIAVTGSVGAGTTHVMLRGCTDHSAYVFVQSQNTWIVTHTNVLEISTGGQPQTGTGSVFWELSTAAAPDTVMVYDPVRALSIPLETAHGPSVVVPASCYASEPFDHIVAPGCTSTLSSSARHLGGHEIVLDGTWPQVRAGDPAVTCNDNRRQDTSSPKGWSFDVEHATPWFAQYTMLGPWRDPAGLYTHTWEPIGSQTIGLPTVQSRQVPIPVWSYLLNGLNASGVPDANLEVCGNLSRPDYGDWTLNSNGTISFPGIKKIREGSLFGRAGGFVKTAGTKDVLWIHTTSARIYSYEGG